MTPTSTPFHSTCSDTIAHRLDDGRVVDLVHVVLVQQQPVEAAEPDAAASARSRRFRKNSHARPMPANATSVETQPSGAPRVPRARLPGSAAASPAAGAACSAAPAASAVSTVKLGSRKLLDPVARRRAPPARRRSRRARRRPPARRARSPSGGARRAGGRRAVPRAPPCAEPCRVRRRRLLRPLAVERQEDQPEHVARGQERRDAGEEPEIRVPVRERAVQQFVLAEEARRAAGTPAIASVPTRNVQ